MTRRLAVASGPGAPAPGSRDDSGNSPWKKEHEQDEQQAEDEQRLRQREAESVGERTNHCRLGPHSEASAPPVAFRA